MKRRHNWGQYFRKMEEVTTVEDDGDVIDIDNAQKEPFSSSGTSMLESSSYKCVVCGSSLQHIATLQGRIFHLKKYLQSETLHLAETFQPSINTK